MKLLKYIFSLRRITRLNSLKLPSLFSKVFGTFFFVCSQVPYKCVVSVEIDSDLLSIPFATVSISGEKVRLISHLQQLFLRERIACWIMLSDYAKMCSNAQPLRVHTAFLYSFKQLFLIFEFLKTDSVCPLSQKCMLSGLLVLVKVLF